MRENIGEDEVNDVDLSTEGQETPAVVQQNNTPKNRKLPKNLRKIKHFIDNHPNETFTISEIAKKTKMDYAKVYGYYKRGSLIEYKDRIILPGAERTIETEPEVTEETYQEKMQRIQEERKQYAEADKEREESIKMGNIEPEKKTDIKEEIKSEEKEEEIKQVEIKEEVKPEEKRGETMKEKTKSETTKDNSVILPTMGTNMGIPISLNSTNVKITGMPETKEKILENLEE